MISNYTTEQKGRVPSDKNITGEKLDKLLELADSYLTYDKTYAWTANINGILIRLVTNSFHQYDFWTENWVTAPAGLKPHAFIYSICGVEGEKPFAYYCAARDTSVFINTEYYGQCKSWALGMAAKLLEQNFGTHSIHGASVEIDGRGVVLVAPTGTGKTTQVNKLFRHPAGKILGDDWLYVFHGMAGNKAPLTVTQPERSLYMRTENAKNEPRLAELFDRCKCENVAMDFKQCKHEGPCGFKQGNKHCYWGFENARALVLREWLAGREKIVNQTSLNLMVLLRRDDHSPAIEELTPKEAVKVLRNGEYMIRPGAGPKEMWGKMGNEAWYNPYLLVRDDKRQEQFFLQELANAKCIIINTGLESETVEVTYNRIIKAAESC